MAAQLHLAQRAHAAAHNGSFAATVAALVRACAAVPSTGSNGCDAAALPLVAARPDVFMLGPASVTENATVLTRECSARPCYSAAVRVRVPAEAGGGGYSHGCTVTINENHLVRVAHDAVPAGALVPCL